ncbi:hypothetical protein HK101_008072 [Irineochytrium annulatum]|nr:hypothetical protein HK101_008072 [Irineochytrium annulatum]
MLPLNAASLPQHHPHAQSRTKRASSSRSTSAGATVKAPTRRRRGLQSLATSKARRQDDDDDWLEDGGEEDSMPDEDDCDDSDPSYSELPRRPTRLRQATAAGKVLKVVAEAANAAKTTGRPIKRTPHHLHPLQNGRALPVYQTAFGEPHTGIPPMLSLPSASSASTALAFSPFIPYPITHDPLSSIFSPSVEQSKTIYCCGQAFAVTDFLLHHHHEAVHCGCPTLASNDLTVLPVATNVAWPMIANTRIVSKLPPPLPSAITVPRSPELGPQGGAPKQNHVIALSSPAETPQSKHWAITTSMTPRLEGSDAITPAKSTKNERRLSAPGNLQCAPVTPGTPLLKKSKSRVGRQTTSFSLKIPKKSQPTTKRPRTKKAKAADLIAVQQARTFEPSATEDNAEGSSCIQRTASTSSARSAASAPIPSLSQKLIPSISAFVAAPASLPVIKTDRRCPPIPGLSPPPSVPVSRCTSPAHAALFAQEDSAASHIFSSESFLLRSFTDDEQAANFMMITPGPSPQTVGDAPGDAVPVTTTTVEAVATVIEPVAVAVVVADAPLDIALREGPRIGDVNFEAWMTANEGIFQPVKVSMDICDVDPTWDKSAPLPITLDGFETETVDTSTFFGTASSFHQRFFESENDQIFKVEDWEGLHSQACDSPASFFDAMVSSASPAPSTAELMNALEQQASSTTTTLIPFLPAVDADRSWKDLIDIDDDAISRLFDDMPEDRCRKDSAYAFSPQLNDFSIMEPDALNDAKAEDAAIDATAPIQVAIKTETDDVRKAFICNSFPFAPSVTLVTPRGFGAFKTGVLNIAPNFNIAPNLARRESSPLSTHSFTSTSTCETESAPLLVTAEVVPDPLSAASAADAVLAPALTAATALPGSCEVGVDGVAQLADIDARNDTYSVKTIATESGPAPTATAGKKTKVKGVLRGDEEGEDGALTKVKRRAKGRPAAAAPGKIQLICEVPGCVKVYHSKAGFRYHMAKHHSDVPLPRARPKSRAR